MSGPTTPRGDAKLRTCVIMAQLTHSRRMKKAQEESMRLLQAKLERRCDQIDSELAELKSSNMMIFAELKKISDALQSSSVKKPHLNRANQGPTETEVFSNQAPETVAARWNRSRKKEYNPDQEETLSETNQGSRLSAELVHIDPAVNQASSSIHIIDGQTRDEFRAETLTPINGDALIRKVSIQPDSEQRRSVVESNARADQGADEEESDEDSDEDADADANAEAEHAPRPKQFSFRWLLHSLARCNGRALAGDFFGTGRRDKFTSTASHPAIHPTSPFMTGACRTQSHHSAVRRYYRLLRGAPSAPPARLPAPVRFLTCIPQKPLRPFLSLTVCAVRYPSPKQVHSRPAGRQAFTQSTLPLPCTRARTGARTRIQRACALVWDAHPLRTRRTSSLYPPQHNFHSPRNAARLPASHAPAHARKAAPLYARVDRGTLSSKRARARTHTHTHTHTLTHTHTSHHSNTGVELMAACCLFYSICVIPLELSLWNDLGPCTPTPTLDSDMPVDLFFMARTPSQRSRSCPRAHGQAATPLP